jgi:protein-tyrosine phosphatase
MSVYWIRGIDMRLGIVPRPRGNDWLDDEAVALQREGIDILVSMLEPDESDELGLTREREAISAVGISFRSFPIPDRSTPESTVEFRRFVEGLVEEAKLNRAIGVHCRAGIGRSSLLIASTLCSQGMSPDDAFATIAVSRGREVPDTPEQVAWLKRFTSG